MTAIRPATRLYVITGPGTPSPRLIEASTPAQALRHVARDVFTVAVAGSLEVAQLMRSGVSVERAREEPIAAAAGQE